MRYTLFDTPVLNSLTWIVSLAFLRVFGWKSAGEPPSLHKFVLIAAPHTSNWDFPFMMAFAFKHGLRIHWMGKHTLFPRFIQPFTAYLGGIAVDRTKPGGMVGQMVEQFQRRDAFIVVIPPEGTRDASSGWKSGFYHIAHGAGVPLVLGFLDYKKKVGGFGPAIHLTGDANHDMKIIAEFYSGITAKYPAQQAIPRLSA